MGLEAALLWLAACFFLALAGRSFFHFDKLKFTDGPFSLSLCLGLGIVFAGVWFICALTGLPFGGLTCYVIFVLAGTLSCIYRYRTGYMFTDEAGEMVKDRRAEKKRFFLGFLFFAIIFLFACFVKGYKPFLDFQTEQYMDYAFIRAMYRQQKVPFEDVWFAGRTVNYYYLGQAAAVFMCRLSFVDPSYGYDLMLCTVFSALTMSVFEVVSAFLLSFKKMDRVSGLFGGVLSGLLVSCGGNGHFLVYGIFKRIMCALTGREYRYWFPDSTMYIGCEPGSLDRGKHEFPAYTMILGDLHAHVINMLFTIPLLALLIDYALRREGEDEREWDIISPHIILLGIFLGLFKGINFWDFPIYFIVCGSVILFCDLKKKGIKAGVIINVLIKGVVILLVSALIMLPFALHYSIPTSGIHLCDMHSPAGKLLIIWFPFIAGALAALIYAFKKLKDKNGDSEGMPVIIAFALCGLGLILLPEIIYVDDIYGDDFKRYNTMFKLTFQAFILLAIVLGTVTAFFFNEAGRKSEGSKNGGFRLGTVLLSAMSLLLISYMGVAVKAWFGDIYKVGFNRGISAVADLTTDGSYEDVREPVMILNQDKSRKLHIIEEAGTSYSPENRLSMLTGASTVFGWYVHEWVWRNDPETLAERNAEVRAFYEAGDEEFCRMMSDKYDLDYIYVGSAVRDKYSVAPEGFMDLGELIWENDEKGWMLIRVNK
ncbi:MAG: hypothetical protein K5857_00750 [Lachnospiraceae bacterium]|nr:hypothetical protein [Lachnospiraceae bacterium]